MTGTLYQTFIDSDNVYAVTSDGLFITNILDESIYAYITGSGYFNSVWSDDDYVFVGTSSNGVQVLDKADIVDGDTSEYLSDYASYPFLTSNNVRYIHGNRNNKLICCTDDGVDIVRRISSYITHTTITGGGRKCFATPNYEYYYYTVMDPTTSGWTLNRLNGNTSDWSSADIVYTAGDGFLSSASTINDIYVTEHTSIEGTNNTLFVATDVGVYAYDEQTTDYYILTTVS